MWEKVTWVHPVKRRFATHVGLTGRVLQQELSGTQTREMHARGATQEEYAALVEEQALTKFVNGLDFSAAPTFRHGYARFDVTLSGMRLVPAAATGLQGGLLGSDSVEGSYTYEPADAALY